MPESTVVNIRIPQKLVDDMDEICQKLGISRSDFIRFAVKMAVDMTSPGMGIPEMPVRIPEHIYRKLIMLVGPRYSSLEVALESMVRTMTEMEYEKYLADREIPGSEQLDEVVRKMIEEKIKRIKG